MLAGINHVALLTADMDRFVAFCTSVFGAKVEFDMSEGKIRHAMLNIGGGAALHPFAIDNNQHANGISEIFGRGHIDHLAPEWPRRSLRPG